MITAEIVLDSMSPDGIRLTTFLLRYPKFIHGEFMTHRVFSRNASSSRAVPITKNLSEVRSDELRAYPFLWGSEKRGMSPGDELAGASLEAAKYQWDRAARAAASAALCLYDIGAHKSIVNRVLEPFLHINVLVTATEYMNFFGLRLDSAADPTMRALAENMYYLYTKSAVADLVPSLTHEQWHLPFADTMCQDSDEELDKARRVSVARCARLSYTSFETGKLSTIDEDLALYDKLLGAEPIHASPAEHQARPDRRKGNGIGGYAGWWAPHEHGNFTGWRQYRKMLDGENMASLPPSLRRGVANLD